VLPQRVRPVQLPLVVVGLLVQLLLVVQVARVPLAKPLGH
jgi:hypothetical protein